MPGTERGKTLVLQPGLRAGRGLPKRTAVLTAPPALVAVLCLSLVIWGWIGREREDVRI